MRIQSALKLLTLVVCLVLLFFFFEASFDYKVFEDLSAYYVILFLFLIFLNALAAIVRLRVIASDLGQKLTFHQATVAFAGGVFGGALFFQLPGQIIARTAVLARHGVSAASVVVITGYERAVAAFVSLLFALSGAYALFGRVAIDGQSGGFLLLKIVVGLFLVATAGAILGWPQLLSVLRLRVLNGAFAFTFARSVLLSLIVQAPMMLAYLVLFQAFNPTVSTVDLIAGIAIVMFAASVPISFAGWGVREVSAVFVMGVIGVPAGLALTAAASVGLGALLMTALIAVAGISWHRWAPVGPLPRAVPLPVSEAFRLDHALMIGLTIAAATLIPFQIFVPTQSGLVNVNLADPLALLAGGLLIVTCIQTRSLPVWRYGAVNAVLVLATVAMVLALLIGASRFGWTSWATTNRFFGWFILVGYLVAGGMIVRVLGHEGRATAARTVSAAIFAVAALELVLVTIREAGIHVPSGMLDYPIAGFSQNRNAFAFQLLVGASLCIAFMGPSRLQTIMLGVVGACLLMVGSRAGWGGAAALLVAALVIRAIDWRQTALVVTISCAIAAVVMATASFSQFGDSLSQHLSLVPDASTVEERWRSLFGGLALFRENPWFGAGLGAFMNQEIIETGRPLVIHSTPIWLLAEFGVVGSAVFFVGFGLLAIASVRLAQSNAPGGKGLLLVLICIAVMSLVHDMMFQRIAWFAIGAFLAIDRLEDAQPQPVLQPPHPR